MAEQTIKLLGQSGMVLATARVVDEGTHFGGAIDLSSTPAEVLALFENFEEIVNQQMLSFLDEIEDKIDALRVQAVFADGSKVPVSSLQVYPAASEVSFKVSASVTPQTFPQAEIPASGYD